jgi:hypothetical protein
VFVILVIRLSRMELLPYPSILLTAAVLDLFIHFCFSENEFLCGSSFSRAFENTTYDSGFFCSAGEMFGALYVISMRQIFFFFFFFFFFNFFFFFFCRSAPKIKSRKSCCCSRWSAGHFQRHQVPWKGWAMQ